MKKAILCVIFLLTSSIYVFQQVQPKVLSSDGDDDNTLDKAKEALEELEKILTAATDVAISTIDGLETSIKVLEESVVVVAKQVINKIGDDVFAKLDELKAEADAFGIYVIDCTEDREYDIRQLLITFLNKVGDCVVDRIDEVLDSLAEIVLDVQSTNNDLKNLTEQLNDCGNETLCILKVIGEIEAAISDLPAKIEEDVNKAKALVNDLEDYLYECEHDNYNQLEIATQEIFNGVVECVEAKIVNPTVVKI